MADKRAYSRVDEKAGMLVVRWESLKVEHWADDWADRSVASSAEMMVAC